MIGNMNNYRARITHLAEEHQFIGVLRIFWPYVYGKPRGSKRELKHTFIFV